MGEKRDVSRSGEDRAKDYPVAGCGHSGALGAAERGVMEGEGMKNELLSLEPLDFHKPEGESVFRVFRLMAYDEGRDGRPMGSCPPCMQEHYQDAYEKGSNAQ
jgi:hypothetical protein